MLQRAAGISPVAEMGRSNLPLTRALANPKSDPAKPHEHTPKSRIVLSDG